MTDRTNPTERLLRRAIIADPADDTLRLAYADWLDEHDRPVPARYVRLAIQGPSADCADFYRRHRYELDAWNGMPYLMGMGADYGRPRRPQIVISRGFVSSLTGVRPRWWCGGRADWLREWYPITRVRFLDTPTHVPTFFYDHARDRPVEGFMLNGDNRQVPVADIYEELTREENRFRGRISLDSDRTFTRAVCRARWPGVEFYMPGDPDDATLENIERHVKAGII